MVKSRLRGGERVSSFEYGMPVSRRAIGSFGTEAILSTEACETRRFAKEVVSSSS